jgi:hypothetical protein
VRRAIQYLTILVFLEREFACGSSQTGDPVLIAAVANAGVEGAAFSL